MPAGTEDRADVADIKNYLETIALAHKTFSAERGDPPWKRPIEALILELGRPWSPQALPKGIKRGVPKQCFANARKLAERRRLRYVEGFALGPDSLLPVAHAWAVDGIDRVIDPTWEDPDRSAYYGVEISLPVLYLMIEIAGQEGYFGSDYRADFITLKLGRLPRASELRVAIALSRAHRGL